MSCRLGGNLGKYMLEALCCARMALARREVPVGAVVVDASGVVLSARHNETRMQSDALAHAELCALNSARSHSMDAFGNGRLDSCLLVSTLEPCLMCLGATVNHRLSRVVFAARSEKYGALSHGWSRGGQAFPHVVDYYCAEEVEAPLGCGKGCTCADESRALLRAFFEGRRAEQLGALAARDGEMQASPR